MLKLQKWWYAAVRYKTDMSVLVFSEKCWWELWEPPRVKGENTPPHYPNRICLSKVDDKISMFLFLWNMSKDLCFFVFTSWMCGNRGCGDDSNSGIISYVKSPPLFTLVHHFSERDLCWPPDYMRTLSTYCRNLDKMKSVLHKKGLLN